VLELVAVRVGDLRHPARAARRQAQFHLAPVHARRLADDQPAGGQAIDQAHGAVVLQEQLLRQVVDGDGRVGRPRPQDQQRLVMRSRQARPRGRGLAEVQERAQGVAERSEPRVVAVGQGWPAIGRAVWHFGLRRVRSRAPPHRGYRR
jgi:hypothetical protein